MSAYSECFKKRKERIGWRAHLLEVIQFTVSATGLWAFAADCGPGTLEADSVSVESRDLILVGVPVMTQLYDDDATHLVKVVKRFLETG